MSFGSFGGFGTTAPPTTSTGFAFGGQPVASVAPSSSTGFGFGGTAPLTFGSNNLFGNPTTTTSTGFAFGAAPTAAVAPFGAAPTTSAPAFGTSNIFGTNTFGGTTGGGFTFGGTPATTTAGFGAFGTGTSVFGGLGATPATTTGSTFSFGSSGFGTNTTQATGFGFGTGVAPFGTATGTGFGTGGSNLFGTSTSTVPFGSTGTFGTTGAFGTGAFGVAAPPQQQQPNNVVAMLTVALFSPAIYGDERDLILAKWNRLQAFWGIGKAYYSPNAAPIDLTPENPFCRFKAIGYTCLPTAKNEDGLISVIINKKESEVRLQQQQLVDSLHRVLGSKPTLSVCVEGVKPSPADKCEVSFYVLERSPTGVAKRIITTELFGYLNQPNVRQQLLQMTVEAVVPKAAPSKDHIKQYLESPPVGIDNLIWQQAQLDNPNPDCMIPVPMIGFQELLRRLKGQEEETQVQQSRLDLISTELEELQRQHNTTIAKLTEQKRKHNELAHRVLKVMVRQEILRKQGTACESQEEQLKIQLEAIQAELSAPNQCKGRLQELISKLRIHKEKLWTTNEEKYTLDVDLKQTIKQHLKQQQEGLTHLMSIIRDDLETLKITEGIVKEVASVKK